MMLKCVTRSSMSIKQNKHLNEYNVKKLNVNEIRNVLKVKYSNTFTQVLQVKNSKKGNKIG